MFAYDPFIGSTLRYALFLIVCFPFVKILDFISNSRHPTLLNRRVKHKRRAKMAPVPLPEQRRRKLSFPLQQPAKVGLLQSRLQKTSGQHSCALLSKLPAEIRNMIWINAIAGNKIRILKKWKRLGSTRCRHVGEQCPQTCVGYYDADWYRSAPSLTGCCDVIDYRSEQTNLLSLLLTCRMIYSEAIDFLYSHNDFTVRDLDCITYLSTTTLPRRFNAIHTLQLNWCIGVWQNSILRWTATPPYDWESWETTWQIVARMEGLRVLRLGLTLVKRQDVDWETEVRLFEPFKDMRHIDSIEIVTSWQSYPDARQLEVEGNPNLSIKRQDPFIVDNPPWSYDW